LLLTTSIESASEAEMVTSGVWDSANDCVSLYRRSPWYVARKQKKREGSRGCEKKSWGQ
jgi:hypothetical protein